MGTIGIIANPAAGKDIRRIIGSALVVNNQQKLNILERLLTAVDEHLVEKVYVMPEYFGFGERLKTAFEGKSTIAEKIETPLLLVEGSASDTLRATAWMVETGVDCLIVLGGDGTTRLVSRVCGDVPIISVSTGTNNVIPQQVEGTVAGLALSYFLSLSPDNRRQQIAQHKVLRVLKNGELVDQALVDIAVLAQDYVGSRAVWDAATIRQIFVTRAAPTFTGISSIVGLMKSIPVQALYGYQLNVGMGGLFLNVPLVPGKLDRVEVDQGQQLDDGVRVPISDHRPVLLAFDGEREISIFNAEDQWEIEFSLQGPWLVDIGQLLEAAVRDQFFLEK